MPSQAPLTLLMNGRRRARPIIVEDFRYIDVLAKIQMTANVIQKQFVLCITHPRLKPYVMLIQKISFKKKAPNVSAVKRLFTSRVPCNVRFRCGARHNISSLLNRSKAEGSRHRLLFQQKRHSALKAMQIKKIISVAKQHVLTARLVKPLVSRCGNPLIFLLDQADLRILLCHLPHDLRRGIRRSVVYAKNFIFTVTKALHAQRAQARAHVGLDVIYGNDHAQKTGITIRLFHEFLRYNIHLPLWEKQHPRWTPQHTVPMYQGAQATRQRRKRSD